jgi:hypothetical protein
MPRYLLLAMMCLGVSATAMAQDPPARIGNRQNGMSYQPDASVQGREERAGLASDRQQKATNRDVEQIDKDLLRQHGLDESNAPNISKDQR